MAAAVHAARASPPHLQTMHSVLRPTSSLAMAQSHSHSLPIGNTKHLLPLSFPDGPLPSLPFYPFPPAPPLPPPPPSLPQASYDEEMVEEDIDEDDMSDLDEEELQKEVLAFRTKQQEPDMTRQLLSFAEKVNADINIFFGRKRGDEDSCDVYEDKWTITKSGRELYYADLLRIAAGDFGDSKPLSSKSSSSRHKDVEVLEDNRQSFSGKADFSLGLGPLKELFEHGLQAGKEKKGPSHHSVGKRPRAETDTTAFKSVPMHQRPFPDSFWREPGLTASNSSGTTGFDLPAMTQNVVQGLGPGKLPDFSDLMDSWHGDQSQLHHHQMHMLQPVLPQHHHHHRPTSIDSTLVSSDSSRKRKL